MMKIFELNFLFENRSNLSDGMGKETHDSARIAQIGRFSKGNLTCENLIHIRSHMTKGKNTGVGNRAFRK